MPDGAVRDVIVQLDIVEHDVGVYYLSCQSPYGETNVRLRLPAEGTDLLRRLHAVETSVLRSAARTVTRGTASRLEAPVRQLGEELCDAVLHGEARVLFDESLRQARRDRVPFRLLLRIRGATLARLPWEFLFDRQLGDYLALNVPVVRCLEVMQPLAPVPVTLPLRILGVISRPHDREALDVAAEQEALSAALAPLGADRVRLDWLPGQRWEDLWRAARTGPWHVLHFIGHGGFDADRGEGFLELADDTGAARPVYASDLGRLLQDNGSLRVVVLNACETARTAGSDSLSSPAASLIRRGFPALVAMQYEISDPAALVFAQAMYAAIAAGEPLDRAVTDARTTVQMSQPGTLEWGTPVLYLRSTNTKVFEVAPPPARGGTPWASPEPAARPDAEDVASGGDPVPDWFTAQQPGRVPHPPTRRRPPAAPLGYDAPPRAAGLRETHRFEQAGPVRAVVFDSPRDRLCAGGDDGAALCWALDRCEVVRCCRLPGAPTGIRALSVSGDGRYLAVAYADPTVRVWDLDTEVVSATIRLRDGRTPWSVHFAPDDRLLAVGCSDQLALLVDRRGAEVVRLPHRPEAGDGASLAVPRDVYAARFSPDGRWVATGASDGVVRLFDQRATVVTRLPHPGPVLDVAFRPDGRRLATACADANARVWDPRGHILGRLNHHGQVHSVAYSPDSRWLASGAADSTARLWLGDEQPIGWALHGGAVGQVALAVDAEAGSRVAAASADRTVRVWAPIHPQPEASHDR